MQEASFTALARLCVGAFTDHVCDKNQRAFLFKNDTYLKTLFQGKKTFTRWSSVHNHRTMQEPFICDIYAGYSQC